MDAARKQEITHDEEERLKAVLNEVRRAEGGIVMFIDEIHLLLLAWDARAAGSVNSLPPFRPRTWARAARPRTPGRTRCGRDAAGRVTDVGRHE
jgi:hypothetical protein